MNRKNILLSLVCILFAALSLAINWNCSIQVLDGPHDSLRYIGMAETIIKGQWLGQYDHMTLIRLPMYSIFVALNAKLGWPLHIVQQIIFLLSIFLLVAALKALKVAHWRTAIVFALCALHPLMILSTDFVATELLYTPAATALLAGCLGLLGTVRHSRIQYGLWVIVVSISSVLFWYTRPEGVWIFPFGVICLGFLVWSCRDGIRNYWIRIFTALFAPCLVVLLVGHYLMSQNEKHYGVKVTHELSEPNLTAAFNWLTRLAPDSHRPYVPITKEAMGSAYEISPHFALLKPYLSKQTNGQGWAKFGCEWMGICDELAGGWTLWAIRDAAASIGLYSSAAHASEFYGAVAREIRQACEKGTVKYSTNSTGNLLAPPVTLTDVPRILISSAKLAIMAITFGKQLDDLETPPEIHASPGLIARYQTITHDQNSQCPCTALRMPHFYWITYRMIQIGGVLLVAAMFAAGLLRFKWKKHSPWQKTSRKMWIIAICVSVFVLSRLALIAYIDAMSFEANLRYLLTIYPAMIVLIGLALPSLQKLNKRKNSHDKK